MSAESREITQAVKADDRDLASQLCQQHLAKLSQGGDLQALFDMAAVFDKPWAMDLFCQHGADVNGPIESKTGQGTLYSAAVSGSKNAVRWLLDHGAPVNLPVQGAMRSLPLYVAIRLGHFEIVRLLVERGAETKAAWNGESPLECARSHGRTAIAEYLAAECNR